ncbi:GNAT family N-acetyltransferase [Senegalia massiliensis]|uniref:N-acetyltransferase n=1 Tax=Senegalia massiliensis TaxID=1720316 RepID=A0A845QWP4_9CLOT|nr:GNAT family protein [Senegalia massiliensis]NBI05572.1 N-acetyltransferase [Senegalia massiliensis]
MAIENFVQPDIINIDEKLRLRKSCENEWQYALPWYEDSEVLYYSEGIREKTYDLEIINRMYTYLSDNGELYFIEILHERSWIPIGDVTLSDKMMPIVIGNKKYWGKGIAKKVLHILIERAKDIGLSCIKLKGIYKYNERSKRLFKSVGFYKISEDEKEEYYELKL